MIGGMRMEPSKPIKGFVGPRAKSIADQLAGKSEGATAGAGMPAGFNPSMMLAGMFTGQMDANKDGLISREELATTLEKWFTNWDADKKGSLSREQLSNGIDTDLNPMRMFGGPGGPR